MNVYKSTDFSVSGHKYEDENGPVVSEHSLNWQRHIKYYEKIKWRESGYSTDAGQINIPAVGRLGVNNWV